MWADSIQVLDYIQLIYDNSVTTQNLAFLSYWYRKKLTFMWQCIVTNFFLIKPKDALISQIFFCFSRNSTVSGSSSAHRQEISTVHSAVVYVMQVCRQLSNKTRMELQFHPGRARKLSSNLHDIYQRRMYSENLLTMGRGTARNM